MEAVCTLGYATDGVATGINYPIRLASDPTAAMPRHPSDRSLASSGETIQK